MFSIISQDTIGFHTSHYACNFLECAKHVLGSRCRVVTNGVYYMGRFVAVGIYPIGGICFQPHFKLVVILSSGIPFEKFENLAITSLPSEILSSMPHLRLILGVDRLEFIIS